MKNNPTFEEIKRDLSKDDLLEIISMALGTGDIQESINDFVDSVYEADHSLDEDFIYEQYRENLLSA